MPSITLEITIKRAGEGAAGTYYVAGATLIIPQPSQRVALVPPIVRLALDPLMLRGLTLQPQEYSQVLTSMVFEPRLLRALGYAQGYQRGIREPIALRIALDPDADELHALRWELLREPPDGPPLSTSGETIFARTFLPDTPTGQNLVPAGNHRALVAVADPPAHPLPSDPPVDYVALASQSLAYMRPTVLDGRDGRRRATLAALNTALGEGPEVLYLVSHGAMIGGQPLLYLEQEGEADYRPTEGLRLIEVIAQQPRPLLVVLLSCDSAGNDYEALAAIGPRLAKAGVPAVLAMHGQVSPAFVAVFVPQVLDQLRRDGRVDRAVAVARRSIGLGDDAWKPILWTSFDDPDIVSLGFTPPSYGRASILRGLEAERVPEAPRQVAVANLPAQLVTPNLVRADDLRAVARAFVRAVDAGLPPAVVVTGEPGLGKTYILREFAYRYGHLFEGGVYWATCHEGSLLEEELLAWARAGLLSQEDLSSPLPLLILKVQERLKESTHRLLIFDSCERSELIAEYLPQGGCFLLASAQSYDTSPSQIVQLHPLAPLTEELGVDLLRAYREGLSESEARALVVGLAGRPLALHCAGTLLAHQAQSTAWALLSGLDGELRGASTVALPGQRTYSMERLVHYALDKLQGGDDVDRLAFDLVGHAGVFAPGWAIDRAMLLAIVAAERGVSVAAFLERALERALSWGLLFAVRGEGPGQLQMHALVVRALQSHSDQTQCTETVVGYVAANCAKLLTAQGASLVMAEQLRALLRHVRFHTECGTRLGESQRAELHTILAAYYRLIGTQVYAEREIRVALDLHDKSLRAMAQQVVQGYREAAEFEKQLGNTDREIAHLERAQEIIDTVARESFAERANIVYLLAKRKVNSVELTAAPDGAVEQRRAKVWHEAVALLVKAEDLLRKAGGSATEMRANVLHERGVIYFAMGAFDRSAGDLERALTIRDELYEVRKSRPDGALRDGDALLPIGETLYNLGSVEMRRGDLESARGCLERALEIRHAVSADLDDQTIAVITALLLCLSGLGDHVAAAKLRDEEIRRAEAWLSRDHLQVRRLKAIFEDLE